MQRDPRLLCELAKAGDREAFGELYALYRSDVYQQVRRRAPSRAVAEDLTQDVFVRALRNITAFEWVAGGFTAWLATIARNLVHDYWKSAAVQRTEYIDNPLSPFEPADSHRFADPADAAIHALEAHELRLAILRLRTEEQAEAVLHRYIDEKTISETCALMGLSEGAMKALCLRAMKSLRRALVPS